MIEFLHQFFLTDGFMPHGHCYLWTPSLLWTYVVSDTVIAISYFSIPFALIYFLNKRRDIPFHWVVIMFATFILSCGVTHAVAIWTIWHPAYGLDASVKAFTALMSLITAVMLWPLIPMLIRIPSIQQLQSLNAQLQMDIAARKAAEVTLAESEERLRFALEACSVGAWELDLLTQKAYRSSEHDRIFGYAERLPEWSYDRFIEHVLPEDRDAVNAAFTHATATNGSWNFECRIRRTDGTVHWIWANGHHSGGVDGARQRMSGVEQNITARKVTEEAIVQLNATLEQRVATRTVELEHSNIQLAQEMHSRQRAEERFRHIVDSAPNAMVMINDSGTIEMVNTQTESVFGYAREELLGQPIEMLVPERYRHQHPTLRSAFFTDPNSRPMGNGRDLFGRRKDSSEFPIEIGLNPIQTDEGIKVLSAIVDITERKAKELKIEAALVEKNILLGEIHHRVKNNLQIIHSLLDLQSTRVSDQKTLDILRDSQNRIRSMAIIHQTLYQANDFANVNFSAVLETLVPAIAETYSLHRESITYSLNVSKVLISINLAIPCGLIVNELITNALKHAFTGRESGEIVVSLSQEGQQITLSVSDNGIGIGADIDMENHSTLGVQLIYLLAEQIHATFDITRSNPTRFELVFSANHSL